ncbi:MAG: gliding motility lipoprotein GldB [Cyclobacteriaceae bacterium]
MKKILNYPAFSAAFLLAGSFILALSMLTGCSDNSCKEIPDVSSIEVEVSLMPLESQLLKLDNWQETEKFLGDHRVFSDYFLHANQYPHDSILAKRLYRLLNAPSIDTLFRETSQKFADMDGILDDFKQAYKIIKYHYPETRVPKLATVVTAFYNDLYISDSLIIVGLDYFLGEGATFRPDEHQYILKRFKKESLMPTVLNFVSNEFNQIDRKHNSLIADMINIGKSYYFTSQVMPCTPDSLIIGYTAEEMKLVNENQEIIWANLIENELLYETNDYMKNKFIGERPNVSEISEKCPGRVGAWVGWEIVKAYMDKNNVSITELMAETDAHKIFQQAKYRPKGDG